MLIYQELEKQCGIDCQDRTTWHSDVWPKFHEIKFDPVFDPIGGKKTRSVLDELLRDWERPSNWGQFAVSIPKPDEHWRVPHYLWHTDFGFDQTVEPMPGVLLISFITDVGPQNGATVAIEGSHRLVMQYVDTQTPEFRKKMRRVRESLMKSDPWLVDLADPETPERHKRFMRTEKILKGCRVSVRELVGKAGDIVVGHPWLLHTISQNCGVEIRMRRIQRIRAC